MNKAVLIMDMPENCFKCKLSDFATCRIANKCHVGDKRPGWCPLRELPEKNAPDNELALSPMLKGHIYEYERGWNACLDEISREQS